MSAMKKRNITDNISHIVGSVDISRLRALHTTRKCARISASVVNELIESSDNVHIVRVNGPLNGGLKIRYLLAFFKNFPHY